MDLLIYAVAVFIPFNESHLYRQVYAHLNNYVIFFSILPPFTTLIADSLMMGIFLKTLLQYFV